MSVPEIQWHLFDVTKSYLATKINWVDRVIRLKDDKSMICFTFDYYPDFSYSHDMVIPIGYSRVNMEQLTTYFSEHVFQDLSARNPEHVVDDFIIMPMYETRDRLYMAIINTKPGFTMSMPTVKFHSLFNIGDGLQNHASILGITNAISFNLFKALCRHYMNNEKQLYRGDVYDYLKLSPEVKIPLHMLYTHYTYFPLLQVVWESNALILSLPGGLANKQKKNTVIAEPMDVPMIPRVAYSKHKERKTGAWQRNYDHYCSNGEGEHYISDASIGGITSMDKLSAHLGKLKLVARSAAPPGTPLEGFKSL